MTAFGAYARYYDLIYRQKDYTAEAGYMWDLLCESGRAPRAVLDLGCGTGFAPYFRVRLRAGCGRTVGGDVGHACELGSTVRGDELAVPGIHDGRRAHVGR